MIRNSSGQGEERIWRHRVYNSSFKAFVPNWARNELEARKRRMVVSVSSVLVFMLGESIANCLLTEGNGLVERGIIDVMTRGNLQE